MPAAGQAVRGGGGPAFAMIDGVDANDSESCLVCVSARQSDEPLTVLAVTPAVSEKEQGTCVAGIVETRRNVANDQSFLPHGLKIRGLATTSPWGAL